MRWLWSVALIQAVSAFGFTQFGARPPRPALPPQPAPPPKPLPPPDSQEYEYYEEYSDVKAEEGEEPEALPEEEYIEEEGEGGAEGVGPGRGGVPRGRFIRWPRGNFGATGFGADPADLGPLTSRRSAAEAQGDTTNAVDAVLASMSPGAIAALPEDTLDLIPVDSLRRLSPEQKAVLPEHILAKISSGTYEQDQFLAVLLQSMSVADLDRLQWESVIGGVSARTLNQMGPNQIGAIPWGRIFHLVPPDTVGELSKDVMSRLPDSALSRMTFEQLDSVKPNVLNAMPLHNLRAIPLGHLKRLGPKLAAIDSDTLAAVDKELFIIANTSGLSGAERDGLAAAAVDALSGPARRRSLFYAGRSRLVRQRVARRRLAAARAARRAIRAGRLLRRARGF